MPKNADVGVTADRVSAHQIRNGADKAVRKVLCRGLEDYLERKVFPEMVGRDFRAADVLGLVHVDYPGAGRMEINGALARMSRKLGARLRRVGSLRSGVYMVRGDQLGVPSAPVPASVDDAMQAVLNALGTLEAAARRATKLEARLAELGITIKLEV